MSHSVFCLNFEDNLQDFPKWPLLFIQQLEHKDRTLFWLQIQQLYQAMLWHCYHRQVAKEHPQSKYLSKLTSSLYYPQSGRRKGIQPLRDVRMKEKKGCWCLLKKMVSVSWTDQGVESAALTDAQAYIWQEGFFQVRSAWWSQLMNDAGLQALALELHLAFMVWSFGSALPLTPSLVRLYLASSFFSSIL